MRPAIIILVLLMVIFVSCQKVLEMYNYKDDKPAPNCRITKIVGMYASGGPTGSYEEIYYDTEGRVSGVGRFSDVPYDENNPDTWPIFWDYGYDSLGRLTGQGSMTTYRAEMDVYLYEGEARLPVRDSLFRYLDRIGESLEYDDAGRVIKITQRHYYADDQAPDHTEVFRYYYDLRGNRQEHPSNPTYQGIILYGDKPNLYSINPVWQLQYKDWSVNSPLNAERFSDQGLPLKLKHPDTKYFPPFLDMYYNDSLVYECD